MKDTHLTLRLPASLARALARRARERGVPKSQLAREAVTRYLDPAPSALPALRTAAEIAAHWAQLPHLSREEARGLADDIASGLRALPPVRSPWE
jgi:hypothetical protein